VIAKSGQRNLKKGFTVQNKILRHGAPVLALLLLINSIFPAQALAQGRPDRRTVMVLALPEASGTVGKKGQRLAERVTRDLRARFNVIAPELSAQILSTYLDTADSPESNALIREMDGLLDRYYSFRSGADETLAALEKFSATLRQSRCVGQKCSDLLVTALMTSSWLYFEKRQKTRAARELKELRFVTEPETLHPEYYPSAFRRYFHDRISDKSGQVQSLAIQSNPAAAAVYVNKVYAGLTPLKLDLPAGDHEIAVKAPGRVVQSRKLKLQEGKDRQVNFRLRWDARQKKLGTVVQNWPAASLMKKSSLAEKLAEASHSDFVVLIADQNGQLSTDVYNTRYSQFYKTISDDPALLAQLNLYIHDERPAYWSKNIDRKLVSHVAVASRRQKPLYRKPAFWALVGAVATAAVVGGVLAAQGSADQPQRGGVIIDLGGL
jgi:hypothetical protein